MKSISKYNTSVAKMMSNYVLFFDLHHMFACVYDLFHRLGMIRIPVCASPLFANVLMT